MAKIFRPKLGAKKSAGKHDHGRDVELLGLSPGASDGRGDRVGSDAPGPVRGGPAAASRGLTWRIYRLPGSKEWWLIDHGPGSLVLKSKSWMSERPMRSVSNPAANPRAWIEVHGILYLDPESARFYEAA